MTRQVHRGYGGQRPGRATSQAIRNCLTLGQRRHSDRDGRHHPVQLRIQQHVIAPGDSGDGRMLPRSRLQGGHGGRKQPRSPSKWSGTWDQPEATPDFLQKPCACPHLSTDSHVNTKAVKRVHADLLLHLRAQTEKTEGQNGPFGRFRRSAALKGKLWVTCLPTSVTSSQEPRGRRSTLSAPQPSPT